ncbi:radical SAM protein [Spirochaetia bacterium 38H-sp]|uniref:Radical SAM protein n=1 Tax=Rarispira pelagica TaxID=3141764 RepID=A0ABU9U9T8_9SPIR
MNSFPFLDNIRHIYVTEDALDFPATQRAKNAHLSATWHLVKTKNDIPAEHLNRETLLITCHSGRMLHPCPGTRGHVCCNYLTIDLYEGCPLGCSYCIMQSYLNFAPMIINVDTKRPISELIKLAKDNPDAEIRVGTGEVGDSNYLDPVFRLSEEFIRALAPYNNISFEVKTKTAWIDHLLDIEPKGRAVIAFSVNPQRVIDEEDGDAAGLEERLTAAEKAIKAGYRLAFHFDPIIAIGEWQKEYGQVIDMLGRFDASRIAWISMGTIRYPAALRKKMADRPYLYDEFIPSKDGKFRYLQKRRVEIYSRIKEELNKALPGAPVYMCMESSAVWKKVFGSLPQKQQELCNIFKRVKTDIYREEH